MPLRDVLVFAAVVLCLPTAFRRPYLGLLLFSWLAYMRPQDLCWGFARDMRFSFIVGAAMILGWYVNESNRRRFWRRRPPSPSSAAGTSGLSWSEWPRGPPSSRLPGSSFAGPSGVERHLRQGDQGDPPVVGLGPIGRARGRDRLLHWARRGPDLCPCRMQAGAERVGVRGICQARQGSAARPHRASRAGGRTSTPASAAATRRGA